MSRQTRTIGSIVEIELEEKKFSYAQILKSGIAFFDYYEKYKIQKIEFLKECNVIFILGVHKYAITTGRWSKVGKLPIRESLKVMPMKFIQDSMDLSNIELYDPNTGEIHPSTFEECKGLECAAVWDAEHVESRLVDHFLDRPNKWVKQLELKPIFE